MAPTTVLDKLAGQARSLLTSTIDNGLLRARADGDATPSKPITDVKVQPAEGVLDPHNINNLGFFVLFALIGTIFVLTAIWFFFWAKDGGFHFKEDDWDEYKSTVLRRTGPNGTILSNVTPVTNLGGGSVYKDVDDDGRTVVTDSTGLSGITAGPSDIGAREKRRQKQERRARKESRHRDGEKRSRRSSRAGRHVGGDGAMIDEEAERLAKDQLRSYRNEKPARVGGINKDPDGSVWDGSTNPTMSTASASDLGASLLHNRERSPTTTPTKKSPPAAAPSTKKKSPSATQAKKAGGGGIRKVYSTADRNAEREAERNRAEARRLQEKGRSARVSRRDFSYPEVVAEERRLEAAGEREERAGRAERAERDDQDDAGDHDEQQSDLSGRTAGNSVPGAWSGSDVSAAKGHVWYPHAIPELRQMAKAKAPPKGLSRKGYREGRQDDYAEDDDN